MGKYYKKIKGKRVYLSPIDPDDCATFTQWLNDIEVTRNLTLAHVQITLEGERTALERLSQEHCYSIVTTNDNHLIGNIGLHDINHVNRTAELGILIGDRENRGKGFGAEAIGLLLGYAFQILNLNNVMLKLYAYNEAGYRCYTKCGFQEIGRRRNARCIGGGWYDEIFMDILAADYVAASTGSDTWLGCPHVLI